MIPESSLESGWLAKSFSEVQFNVIGGDIGQPTSRESRFQILRGPQIGTVGFNGTYRRFRIVFQEEIRPLPESKTLTLSDYIKDIFVSGTKALPKFLLRFLPVISESGLPPAASVSVPIPNPPEFRPIPFKYNTIMLNRSRHSPSPV
jgi:hypothetical protein